MLFRGRRITWAGIKAMACVLTIWVNTLPQKPQNPGPPTTSPQQQSPALPELEPRRQDRDEIVRVFTELVQTDVMVFDKQGHFVSGLRPTDFELRVDGQAKSLQSFEQITAGSNEEAQLSAARGSTFVGPGITAKGAVPLDRGRTVFFYVDDFHLDASGWSSAQKLLSNFFEKDMGQNDEAAIISASGQIGFLQQLTDSKVVLQTALRRLSPRSQMVRDGDRPEMTEYQALLIDRNDFDAMGYFVDETMKYNPGLSREIAANIVTNRANALLAQANNVTTNTLATLQGLIRSVRTLPGRKVLFFLSNGFFVETRRGDSVSRIRQVTSEAAKAGVVIYSIDLRGLVAPFGDVSSGGSADPSGRLQRASGGELTASQDSLNALARDSGGKPIFNTNDFRPGLGQALKETAAYYLLAWKPDKGGSSTSRFRNIQVTLPARPELTVRVRRGFFDAPAPAPASRVAEAKPEDPEKEIAAQLRKFLVTPYPDNKLPLALSLDFHDVVGRGSLVSASIQVPGEFMTFGPQGEKTQAFLDIAGAFYDDRGQVLSPFFERIVSTATTPEAARGVPPDVTYTYPASFPPGLYQARVAVRDKNSGKTGSARAWVEIPDLSNRQLALSSLLLGERTQRSINVSNNVEDNTPVNISAAHRFRRESNLRFLVFVYNATSTPDTKPDPAIQIQVVRDDQPVITTGLRRISTDGIIDLHRIPYAAEIPLADLAPGRYFLLVTVIDRVSKSSASRRTRFDIY
jgi:VWFA-related protein